MATKTVTLKDSNGDTLYPVTDSNVVNINQQKTLAQALDGVVYAEDPTQSATPTAWVTGSDVDWSTMRFPVPTNTVLQDIGDVTGNTAIPITYDGFFTGKAITNNTDGHAMVNLANSDNGPFLGGIPYCSPNAVQVAFCIPCHAGQTFYARCGNGRLERIKIVKAEF